MQHGSVSIDAPRELWKDCDDILRFGAVPAVSNVDNRILSVAAVLLSRQLRSDGATVACSDNSDGAIQFCGGILLQEMHTVNSIFSASGEYEDDTSKIWKCNIG